MRVIDKPIEELTFDDCISLAFERMVEKGRWLESGTVVIRSNDEFDLTQYSYKVRRLKQKAKEESVFKSTRINLGDSKIE